MSETTAKFRIELDDETSGAAAKAAGSLNELREALKRDTAELAEMNRALKNLQAGTVVNVKQVDELRSAIDTKRQAISLAQSSYLQLGGTFAKVQAPAVSFMQRMQEVAKAEREAAEAAKTAAAAEATAMREREKAEKLAVRIAARQERAAARAQRNVARQEAKVAAAAAAELAKAEAAATAETERFARAMEHAAVAERKQAAASKQSSSVFRGGSIDIEHLGKAASLLPGPIGNVSARLTVWKDLLAGGGIQAGVVALTAAIAALVIGTVAAIVALTKYGVAQANARRAEGLRLEGLTKMRNWWGIAAGNAKEMQAALDKVSDSTTLGRDKLEQYQAQLYSAGLRGKNLTDALEGMAIKADAQGEALAQAWAGWASATALTGGSVRKMTDDVKARLGGIVARKMLDVNVLAEKIRSNFGRITDGLKIEPLLRGLKMIVDFFSQSTANGRALRSMFNALFQPLVDGLSVGSRFKRFWQGMIIEAQRFIIVMLSVRNWFRRAFSSGVESDGNGMTRWLVGGRVLVMALAVAFSLAAAAVIAFTWPFLLAAAAVWGLFEIVSDLYDLWAEIDWSGMGTALVDGIIGGVKRAWKGLIDVVGNLADDVKSRFKSLLGIASPSKVFAELGGAIPKGVELGITAGTPGVQRAVEGVVEVPSAPRMRDEGDDEGSGAVGGGAAAAGGNGGGRTTTITIGEVHVHAPGDKAAELGAAFKRQLETVLEGIAIELGASTGKAS